MRFRIAVVDDMSADCERIVQMLAQYQAQNGAAFEVTVCHTGEEFFRVYHKGAFQIIFLDICMEGMDGVALSHRLRISDEAIRIIFMSTEHEYVFDVWRSQPTSFLCKPCSYEKFAEAMDIALTYFRQAEKHFMVKLPRSEQSVKQSDILSVVADNHSTIIRLVTGERYLSTATFSEVSEILSQEPNFLLCNRGVLINMDYAECKNRMTDESIEMFDGTFYPIHVRTRKQILQELSAYHITKKLKGRALMR